MWRDRKGSGVGAYFDWWDGRERRALVLDGERLTVGSATDNDVVIDDSSVSRVHALLHQLNGRWFIEDCGSRNGTAVNGHQLTSMHPLRPRTRCGSVGLASRSAARCPPAGHPTDAVVERPAVTAREHDVLVALCRPLANGDVFTEPATVREIAADLAVSENAIKLHLAQPRRQVRHRRTRTSTLSASPTPRSTPASSRSPTSGRAVVSTRRRALRAPRGDRTRRRGHRLQGCRHTPRTAASR